LCPRVRNLDLWNLTLPPLLLPPEAARGGAFATLTAGRTDGRNQSRQRTRDARSGSRDEQAAVAMRVGWLAAFPKLRWLAVGTLSDPAVCFERLGISVEVGA
jgi:hypothetical protein